MDFEQIQGMGTTGSSGRCQSAKVPLSHFLIATGRHVEDETEEEASTVVFKR